MLVVSAAVAVDEQIRFADREVSLLAGAAWEANPPTGPEAIAPPPKTGTDLTPSPGSRSSRYSWASMGYTPSTAVVIGDARRTTSRSPLSSIGPVGPSSSRVYQWASMSARDGRRDAAGEGFEVGHAFTLRIAPVVGVVSNRRRQTQQLTRRGDPLPCLRHGEHVQHPLVRPDLALIQEPEQILVGRHCLYVVKVAANPPIAN